MASIAALSGCAHIGYLAQSASGHWRLVAAARPVPEWLNDPATPAALRERLHLSQRMRDFAVSELKLPDNASYRRYADLGRSAAVWNVVAAPELSLALRTWCYPVVGCVGYRGYYDLQAAEQVAAPLRSDGLDVQVYGVPAYSTLGKVPGDYFADPLLNTFLSYPEIELARLIFHELAHQIAYASGDTTFNESFATAVERIGGERWLSRYASAAAREEFARYDIRRDDFRELIQRSRARLDALFNRPISDAEKRVGKQLLMAQMRSEYQSLKAERWSGFSGYDGWFTGANNASLGLVASYNALVPHFERLFASVGSDFDSFYAEVRRLASLTPAERKAAFAGLAS